MKKYEVWVVAKTGNSKWILESAELNEHLKDYCELVSEKSRKVVDYYIKTRLTSEFLRDFVNYNNVMMAFDGQTNPYDFMIGFVVKEDPTGDQCLLYEFKASEVRKMLDGT